MDAPVLSLILLNFLLIGLLPRIFFRRGGQLNFKWWLTASGFFIVPLLLVMHVVRGLPLELMVQGDAARFLGILTVFPSAASIGLLFMTLGTHRIPIALWHQQNDAPKHVVTYGAYKYIRHPFYASFLLAFFAAFLAVPHPLLALLLLYEFTALNVTAAREERNLAASEFGQEYRDYMKKTGRFFPRWRPAA